MDPAGIAALRSLPAVGTLLGDPDVAALIETHGHQLVRDAARDALDTARNQILTGLNRPNVDAGAIKDAIARRTRPTLRRVVNATGVILHTNLGRAVLADAAQKAIADVASGYGNVELDLSTGARGDRHEHISRLLQELLGTDGGLAFNNCAGAVLLMLGALTKGGEVIVSRGQLVEIGGGFRVPDVMRESQATLVEVGTTNKVYARDYAAAMTENTKAILVIHRSNFEIVGFTHEPTLKELRKVADEHQVHLLYDLGSGLIADAADLGAAAAAMERETRPKLALAEGVDLVAFSGDKLLGGPQAGLLAGKRELLTKVRKHPLARALRADKLTMAGLEATLRLYRNGQAKDVPVIRDLGRSVQEIEQRCQRIATGLAGSGLEFSIVDGQSVPGGGSLPLLELPTRILLVGPPGAKGRALESALRSGAPPVMTRVVDDRVAVDPRTLLDGEIPHVAAWLRNAAARSHVLNREEG